tara:strand:+ start:13 stop:525 length:513 start_codon:yes stop_codon:yes gene_type:complete
MKHLVKISAAYVAIIFTLVGCSQPRDLFQIANEGRLIKFGRIYDCRHQERHIFSDKGTTLLVNLADLDNKIGILHRADWTNLILPSTFDYKIDNTKDKSHAFENSYYDLVNITETKIFIRFEAINKDGESSKMVINKSSMTMSPENPNKDLTDRLKAYITLDFERECRKI